MTFLKKFFKFIGILLLILLGLIIIALLSLTVLHRVKLKSNRNYMAEQSFYSAASAGDCDLNLISYGGPDDGERIIALGGAGAGFPLELQQLAAHLRSEYQVYYLARPGYDGSDDFKGGMTPETVVEDYRTALQSAGVEAPYILMPHSLASIYATYWVNKYPDEIRAMVDLDGSCPKPMTAEEIQENEAAMKGNGMEYIRLLINLGIGDVALRGFISENPEYSESEQRISDAMTLMTYGSKAFLSDGYQIASNRNAVWEMMKPNDVPKLYICSSNAYTTAEELEQDDVLKDYMIADLTEDYTGSEDGRRAYAAEKYLEECEKQRKEELEPFTEKLGNCEIKKLPGGHFIHKEKPEECAEIIKAFLAGI